MSLKKYVIACTLIVMVVNACQKPAVNTSETTAPTGVTDSSIIKGDTLMYEVITNDTSGWYGMWNEPDGSTNCNPLDSINYGSPKYYSSGWTHTFICPDKPFQAFISVANRLYNMKITVNLYKNNKLIKTSTNDQGPEVGVAKLLLATNTGALTGTAADPVLAYEVLIDDTDTTQFEANTWLGQWNLPNGKVSTVGKPLLLNFPIPSGWKYIFKPDHLPFTMFLNGTPYTPEVARITVNFYVNDVLVKSVSARNFTYGNTYEVH